MIAVRFGGMTPFFHCFANQSNEVIYFKRIPVTSEANLSVTEVYKFPQCYIEISEMNKNNAIPLHF